LFSPLAGQKTFVASVPEVERVAWTWALFFALIIPEIGTFLRSVRICLFKSYKKPPVLDFMVVLVAETLHMIGIGILAFVVFPELDIVKAAMLTNCVCFVPGVLSN
jgi:chitin synthase